MNSMIRGGFKAKGGGRPPSPPPPGIRPPADPNGPSFWATDPKMFLKAPLEIFQKLPKNGFFFTVFSKICRRRRKFCQKK